jgi:uncharacterized protein
MPDIIEKRELIIEQTKNWIKKVVIGCNFCPFAAREMKQDSIYYHVEMGNSITAVNEALSNELIRLDNDKNIGTILIIIPDMFEKFSDYLDYVALAESILKKKKYTGIYQIASFHPLYQFAGTQVEDVVNYTNKSIYPMLHILREEKITEALLKYPDPENIPNRNIDFAKNKGKAYMKMLRDSCL